MKGLKDKMYNYEVTPPSKSWQIITAALDQPDFGNIRSLQKRNKAFYVTLVAAAVTIMIFSAIIQFTNPETTLQQIASVQPVKKPQLPSKDKITAPQAIEATDELNNLKSANSNAVTPVIAKKYITISGPQGQPIKISSKVISLIVSSDDQDPPNPVWNDKVKKWKDIMKANILGSSTANFLDIVDLTHAVSNQ